VPAARGDAAYIRFVREIPLDEAPREIAAVARAAARGQIIYLTEDGQRLAAIVPPEFAAELEDLSPEEVLDLLADLTDDRADPPVDS
jgi:antitoxin (DNA-binding transcriptional repressor) of toxin-antitoxin stability system